MDCLVLTISPFFMMTNYINFDREKNTNTIINNHNSMGLCMSKDQSDIGMEEWYMEDCS